VAKDFPRWFFDGVRVRAANDTNTHPEGAPDVHHPIHPVVCRSAAEIARERFGDRVADAVNAMTKTFRGTVRDPRVVFDQIASDLIASVAKGSDRIHNQHTAFGVFTADKIRDYVTETEEYFLPMLR
jgi:hypothetical protein